MCGIVGVAGNLLPLDKAIFTELLHADVVRGKHATGMIQVKGKCRQVDNFKLAYPAPLFLDLPVVQQELNGFLQNTVAVGHNRHATKGASGEHKNAHPFQHGHISMVHNGSLTFWAGLTPIGESYTVDSEAICRALEVDGPEIVIPKLRGAFTLVWVNSEDETLNFVRNEERPLAIAMDEKNNKMWWASEMGMLQWSLNRDIFSRKPATYTKMFELPEGSWLSIPITVAGINLDGLSFTPLDVSDSVYVAPVYQRPPYQDTRGKEWDTVLQRWVDKVSSKKTELVVVEVPAVEKETPYTFGRTKEQVMSAAAGKLLDDVGQCDPLLRRYISATDIVKSAAILDDRIGVFVTEWKAYPNLRSNSGTLHGVMIEYPFSQVTVHAMLESDYTKCMEEAHGIISGYVTGFVVSDDETDYEKYTLMMRAAQLRRGDIKDYEWDITKIPTNIKNKQGQDVFVAGAEGILLPWQDWIDIVDDGCSHCDEPMNDSSKADTLEWITDTEYLCGACHFEIANAGH